MKEGYRWNSIPQYSQSVPALEKVQFDWKSSDFRKGKVERMKKALRRRFWLETGVAIITGILFVITLVWHDWVEIVFNVDPDQGNGSLEWLIVAALLVVTIILFILARYEWHKARIAIG